MPAIHLVSPDLFDRPGGIARISRAASLAMATWARTRGHTLHVHVLQDRSDTERTPHVPADAAFHGYGGSRIGMTAAITTACLRRDAIAVFSHVNLTTPMLALPHMRYAIVAHGIEVWSPLSVTRRAALRRARVWAVSEYTARIVRSLHGIPASRVRTVANCIDPFWRAPTPDPHPHGAPYFLLVSRLASLEEQKGVGHTISSFALAADRGWIPPNVELHIVGDGHQRLDYEREARRSRYGARIRFFRRVDDATLQRAYAHCIAFVLPSAKEGFGLVFLEAMANGKPVIAAAAGAAPEVVTNEKTGLVVPYGDVTAIATALSRLCRDEGLRTKLGACGRNAVETAFGFAQYERKLHAELDALRDR